MFDQNSPEGQATAHAEVPQTAREWVKILAKYRDPSATRSIFELAVTFGPFVLLWALAWWAMSISAWLALGISVVNAAFVLRLFAIQHDCGHGAFFANRTADDWVGRVLGVFTLTPYDVWRSAHSMHHSASGNLDRRGMGDINTLTVAVQNRLPLGFTNRAKYWASAMLTNAGIFAALGLIIWFGGIMPVLLIFVPSTLLAATAGVWLFYVQHQFETTHWETEQRACTCGTRTANACSPSPRPAPFTRKTAVGHADPLVTSPPGMVGLRPTCRRMSR